MCRSHRGSLLMLFALGILIFMPAGQCAEPFSFVQMADTQLGMGGYDKDVEAFRLAVNQINALKPDFVLICGDLIDKQDEPHGYTDFNEIRKGFTMPCYPLPGNHDMGNAINQPLLDKYRKTIGPDYSAFEHKGYAFLLTNTSLWKTNLTVESDKQDAWFRDEVKKAGAKQEPIIIAGHYPPFVAKPDEDESYADLPKDKRAEILSLAAQYKFKAILAGHLHKNNVTQYEGIPVIATGSTAKNFDGSPRGFRLIKINEKGEITHEYIAIAGAPK